MQMMFSIVDFPLRVCSKALLADSYVFWESYGRPLVAYAPEGRLACLGSKHWKPQMADLRQAFSCQKSTFPRMG